jgi:hypothetical protein
METETRYNVYLNGKLIIKNENVKTVIYWISVYNYPVINLDFQEIKKNITSTCKFLTHINLN